MQTILVALILSAAPAPQFVPIPQFVPVPKFSVVEVPATVEVAEPEPAMVWGIVAWRPGPCPTCPSTPEYGWIEAELTVDQAARKLERWRELPADEVKRLEAIVNAPALKKALRQEWSLGTCGMICTAHGSRAYTVYDDGSVEPSTGTPEATGTPTGGSGWYPGKIIGKVIGKVIRGR